MRVLILHSDVPPDAPPDDQDTLLQAIAIESTLAGLGHEPARAVFTPDPSALEALIARECPDLVFNLVETVWGKGLYGALAPQMLGQLGVPFTGGKAAAIAACTDKILSKRLLRGAGLPTPDWSEPPHWGNIGDGRWIVKSVSEDASLGLDDGAVVVGREAVVARAQGSAARHGGRWFAESYIEGREFNVALIERDGVPYVLPIGEMQFERWDENRPRIIGYAAKWDEAAADYRDTTRVFAWGEREPDLHERLERLSKECWSLFGLTGYARVDFRVDPHGQPYILEINPNPCLEPNAGVAAAAEQAQLPYAALIDDILRAALQG
ncbi:MAG TPA: ATP-grasp domain-containing protein [Micropepsaceae bacterium]|nr:ATP-grasp domain-containing protein [Micropepsaceae bacterium]